MSKNEKYEEFLDNVNDVHDSIQKIINGDMTEKEYK